MLSILPVYNPLKEGDIKQLGLHTTCYKPTSYNSARNVQTWLRKISFETLSSDNTFYINGKKNDMVNYPVELVFCQYKMPDTLWNWRTP
jgi:hypothetical protein